MELIDKIAVVTGVSKGIGYATAKVLLDKGVKVTGWSRTKPDIEHEHFLFLKTNIADLHAVQNAYDQTLSYWGRHISILVNNAGLGFEGAFEELSVEKWHTMFNTNVHGLFYCSRLVIPQMKVNEDGHIINIASVAGTTGIERLAGYSATKHAVRGISHSMYKELREHGIKVTCVYPGSVKTSFFDDFTSVKAHDNMMMPEDIASTIVHVLESGPNYHHVDIEVRPLRPKGKRV
jgi:NADP-dependent 3-hydroxy acid dehydrogenase YdfG